MTGFVLLWCLAQAPAPAAAAPVAVVVSSKRPGADAFSGPAAVRVHAALVREGVPAADALDDVATGKKIKAAGFSDPRSCQGGASCLAKLALLLGPHAVVVGVDVGKVGSQLALRLEAVSAQTGKPVFSTEISAPVEGWGDKVAVPIALFARQLVQELATLAPPKPLPPPVVEVRPLPEPDRPAPPPDAPLVQELTPPPPPQPAAEAQVSARPAAIKWTFGIAALAAAGVSVGFLAAGLGTRAQFNGSPTMVDQLKATLLTAAQADALRSNAQLTTSLACGVVAAVLVATALYFFLTE